MQKVWIRLACLPVIPLGVLADLTGLFRVFLQNNVAGY